MLNIRIETFVNLLAKNERLREKHYLGCGSSREAYSWGEMVIKLPLGYFNNRPSDWGILQSEKEIDVWENATHLEKKILAEMLCHGKINGCPYIVMEKVFIAEDIETDEYIGNVEELAENGYKIPRFFDRIIDSLAAKYNLAVPDLVNNSGNFGLNKDKRIVIADYGFCGWVKSFYENPCHE